MKKIYQVEHSDYGTGTFYGAFEDEALAEKLKLEVEKYHKDNNIHKEVQIREMNIYNADDPIYRYSARIDIKNPDDVTVESIEPTYHIHNAFLPDLETAKQQIAEGHLFRYIVKYGTSQENAVENARNMFNGLKQKNLLGAVIRKLDVKLRKG